MKLKGKLIIFVLATMACFDSQATLRDYTPKQVTDFIKKKQKCQFAVGQTNMTIEQMSPKVQSDEKNWPINPWVLCVDDVVVGAGTIKEKRGCALFYYNIETGVVDEFRRELGGHLMSEQACAKGGFETLLKKSAPISTPYDKFALYDFAPTKGLVPVSTWLTDQGHAVFGVFGRVLLHSNKPAWEDRWKKDRAPVVESWKKIRTKNQAAAKKEQQEKEAKLVPELQVSSMRSVCYDLDVERELSSFETDHGYFLEIVDEPVTKKKKKTFYVLRSKIPEMCKGCKSQIGGGLECEEGYPKLDFL